MNVSTTVLGIASVVVLLCASSVVRSGENLPRLVEDVAADPWKREYKQNDDDPSYSCSILAQLEWQGGQDVEHAALQAFVWQDMGYLRLMWWNCSEPSSRELVMSLILLSCKGEMAVENFVERLRKAAARFNDPEKQQRLDELARYRSITTKVAQRILADDQRFYLDRDRAASIRLKIKIMEQGRMMEQSRIMENKSSQTNSEEPSNGKPSPK